MRLVSPTNRHILQNADRSNAHSADNQQLVAHFLHAGQLHVSSAPQKIILILGSCAGVCIWDQLNGIGGAAHYLLPSWDGRGMASPRYGTVAIEKLLEKLAEAGANREQLRAKVFGGGCLFDSMRGSQALKDSLGERNVDTAISMLASARIPVVCTEAGKDRGQRIVFHTATGESHVSTL